jgi:hypothetical protein
VPLYLRLTATQANGQARCQRDNNWSRSVSRLLQVLGIQGFGGPVPTRRGTEPQRKQPRYRMRLQGSPLPRCRGLRPKRRQWQGPSSYCADPEKADLGGGGGGSGTGFEHSPRNPSKSSVGESMAEERNWGPRTEIRQRLDFEQNTERPMTSRQMASRFPVVRCIRREMNRPTLGRHGSGDFLAISVNV